MPKVKEVTVSTSVGGKMQIVKYQYSSDYHYSTTLKYDVEGMTEEEVKEFRDKKLAELREDLEPIVQKEVDDLVQQRDDIRMAGRDPDA